MNNELKSGMKFRNIRECFKFMGNEEEYLETPHRRRDLKLSEICEWHRINRFTIIIDEVFPERRITFVSQRKTEEDFKTNFDMVKQKIGSVPLFSQFDKYTKIQINTYANHFNLSGVVYDAIVRMYCDDDEFDEYLKNKSEHKTMVGKKNAENCESLSVEELESSLRNVFDKYYNDYGGYPSRRIFDKVSKHDSSIYRKKFGKSWLEVCKMFGYDVGHYYKSETIVLGMCEEIMEEKCERQKTFDWLIGVGGKHMFCDGYFKSANVVIEFDGAQHRIPIERYGGKEKFTRLQENDKLKDKLLNEHGIKVIRINSSSQWHNPEWLKRYINKNMGKV